MPKPLKKLDFDQYVLNIKNFGNPICPCCGADVSERVPVHNSKRINTKELSFSVEWRCRNCLKHWEEKFKFVGVNILEEEG